MKRKNQNNYRFSIVVILTIVISVYIISCGTSESTSKDLSITTIGIEESWQNEYHRLAKQTKEYWQCWMDKDYPVSPFLADSNAVVWKSDKRPVDIIYRRTRALLTYLRSMPQAPDLSKMERHLEMIGNELSSLIHEEGMAVIHEENQIYYELKRLNRQISLSNPLLNFDSILFVSRDDGHPGIIQANSVYNPPAGGGLYVVSGIKSSKPKFRNILEGAEVKSGIYEGKTLSDQPFRVFQGPDLSYDGKQIVFSYAVKSKQISFPFIYNGYPTPFNLFTVNIDGSELTQITNSKWKDYDPCWLPDGRVVFVSERRELSNRCSGLRDYEPAGTLYSVKADGTDLYPISWHEVNELHPSVDNQGRLVYTRWDYVDRDFSVAHHLWISYPDGRDPRAPHANYPYPHQTLDSARTSIDGRRDRPWSEQSIRSIPGEQTMYSAVASGHHTRPAGPIVVIDLSVRDDNKMSQIKIITGNGKMPIDDSLQNDDEPIYVTPWPLSADFFIAAEFNTNNVYLLDKFGNQTLLFSAPVDLPVFDQIPLRRRLKPPVIPTETFQGEREGTPSHSRAVISIQNIYESDFVWPEGTRIEKLRIIEIFPRPMEFPAQTIPEIGFGNGSNARQVLGTVPVEKDGSVFFEAPVEKAIYFQAIDQNGLAIQSMRSCTYVHKGEHLSCMGCHEDKWKSASTSGLPLAFKRKPSKITSESDGSLPFSYARLVKPVLNDKCVTCHIRNGKGLKDTEYGSLKEYAFYFHGSGASSGLDPVHGGYRTEVNRFGAKESKLGKVLFGRLHQGFLEQGLFSKEDLHRITLWLDCNSNELGAYNGAEAQRNCERVWQTGVDPANPTGIESKRPLR